MKQRGLFVTEFIRRVAEEKVQALLIGRQALAVYGAPTATNDIDFLVVSEKAEEQLSLLAEEFGLVKVLEETGGIIYRKKQVKYTDDPYKPALVTRAVDILTIPRLRGFSCKQAWKRRVSVPLTGGLRFYVSHPDDLIALKRSRYNARDKEDIKWLERNRDKLKD